MLHAHGNSPHDKLIRKLEIICELSTEEAAAVRGLPLKIVSIADDADVVREGDRPSDCCLLVEGFLFRYKVLPEGLRQIISIHVAGDIPDLQSLHLERMDHSLGALAPSLIAHIPHTAVLDLVRRFPGLADAFWRDTLVDAAIFREWVVNNGRRNAYQRTAHLICELFVKMQSVGLTKGLDCPFPMTQQEIGDATGLSLVHVNRTLQALRADGLVVLSGKHLTIPDWEALVQAADFDPSYLHLRRGAAAQIGERLGAAG